MTRNEFNLLYAIKNNGIQSYRKLSAISGTSLGFISDTMKAFTELEYINDRGITEKGLEALAPYKVKNAVIMAAGMSSSIVPLAPETPKGLLVVKNEVMIERQIEQLREAGIEEIVIVLGYRKEAFFYLGEKYNVKIIINPFYNSKGNLVTLYLARNYIGNTYICSSDDYFTENVFTDYVYQSYYASVRVEEKTGEWYMIPDAKGNVSRVKKTGKAGTIMLGHAYWNHEFASSMLELMDAQRELHNYDKGLWEELFADYVRKLPPMEIKVYPPNVIFEFDSLEELKHFDDYYVNGLYRKMKENICKVFACDENDIDKFELLNDGLLNRTFTFELFGKQYTYRHPGECAGQLLSRSHEKKALELAAEIGVDRTYLYMDEEAGWKIASFIENARIPNYSSFADSQRVISVLKRIHNQSLHSDRVFRPWEEALRIESLLREKGEIAVKNFDKLKAKIETCYLKTLHDGVETVFCHCDTYAANWLLTDTDTILIDWEYAGNADPGCDVGAYIMDAMYDVDEATRFIKEYCGDGYNEILLFHYLAYVAVTAFYWFLWALYRESCGCVMGASVHNWYVMAVRYSNYLTEGK